MTVLTRPWDDYLLAMRLLSIGVLISALASCMSTDSPCDPFDGCKQDGLVGKTFEQGTNPMPGTTVTAYATATLALAATTRSDADGKFELAVATGNYVLCVAVDGCPADGETSTCCTRATAPVGFASYYWEGGQWLVTLP
jgi:hypothetical protein